MVEQSWGNSDAGRVLVERSLWGSNSGKVTLVQ